MVQKLGVLVAVVALLGASGCATVRSPALGFIITKVHWDGGGHGPIGSKKGESCARSILGVYADGDASIESAARAGNIKTITSVDHYSEHFIVMGKYCTIVRGN